MNTLNINVKLVKIKLNLIYLGSDNQIREIC